MKIGIIDADLLDNGTRFPNLALMKISGYFKGKGNDAKLLLSYDDIKEYDKIYLSKVFTATQIPINLEEYTNIEYGGTGFYYDKAPDLPKEIEHHKPDYDLYNEWVAKEIERGIKKTTLQHYIDFSIGYTTRGCFRKCEFCVNKKYDKASRHSEVNEFLDPKRKYISLLDDNVLACKEWEQILDELDNTGKRYQFRQGLDIRIMTEEKALRLSKTKYHGDFIFAFDHIKDKEVIEKGLNIWRNHSKKKTKLYVLCAYESQDIQDIINIFERIKILFKYECIPYLMRYEEYNNSEFKDLYIQIARWCNQPSIIKKMSFREFAIRSKELNRHRELRILEDFEGKYPILKEYFDLKFKGGE